MKRKSGHDAGLIAALTMNLMLLAGAPAGAQDALPDAGRHDSVGGLVFRSLDALPGAERPAAADRLALHAAAWRRFQALETDLLLLAPRTERAEEAAAVPWDRRQVWVDPLRRFGGTRVIDRPGSVTAPPPSAGLEPGVTLDTSRAIAAMRIDMLRYAPASTFDEAWSRAADALDDLQRQIDTTRWYTPP